MAEIGRESAVEGWEQAKGVPVRGRLLAALLLPPQVQSSLVLKLGHSTLVF